MRNIIYIIFTGFLYLNACSLFDNNELFDPKNPPEEGILLTFTDKRDKQEYQFVRIGEQYWMAENLNYETETGSSYYNYDIELKEEYGRLYDWEAASAACPEGWHLPTDAEWNQLIDYLGGDMIANGKLKEVGYLNWKEPNNKATNESGFTALPGGYHFVDGDFRGMGRTAYFWSATSYYDYIAWARILNYRSGSSSQYYDKDLFYFSVRCVLD